MRSEADLLSYKQKLEELESSPKHFIDTKIFNTMLNVVDENGNDVTETVMAKVAQRSMNN